MSFLLLQSYQRHCAIKITKINVRNLNRKNTTGNSIGGGVWTVDINGPFVLGAEWERRAKDFTEKKGSVNSFTLMVGFYLPVKKNQQQKRKMQIVVFYKHTLDDGAILYENIQKKLNYLRVCIQSHQCRRKAQIASNI